MISGFQRRAYEVVKKIPKGKVLTYKQVAEKLRNAKLARAVGNVLNKNRDSQVPCQRVIKSNGEIGRYNKGISEKVRLLIKEGFIIQNSKCKSDFRLHRNDRNGYQPKNTARRCFCMESWFI